MLQLSIGRQMRQKVPIAFVYLVYLAAIDVFDGRFTSKET